MKKDIEKVLLRWLGKSKTPPVKFWKLFADKNEAVRLPQREKWEHVWKEFVKIYNSNKFLIYNLSKTQLNLPAVKAYFKVEWDKSRLTGRESISSLEERWWKFAKKLMPGKRLLRHINLPECGMHLDIFCPKTMIAIEVQGEQHWRPIEMFGGMESFTERQERDARKRNICAKLGIKLIEVSDCTSALGFTEKFECF
jgi:hypothetical protein